MVTETPAEPASAPRPGGSSPQLPESIREAMRQGDAALADDQPDAARQHYERARELAPSHPAPEVGLLRVRAFGLGFDASFSEAPRDRGLGDVVAELEQLIAKYPHFVPALIEHGRLALVHGQADRALESLNAAQRLEPGHPDLPSALGVAQLATGNAREAVRHFEDAVRAAPRDPRNLTNLGTAYMMRGRLSEAITAFEQALPLAQDDARAHGNLGTAHLADRKPAKALPHLLRATELAPGQATYVTNLGFAYQLLGQRDKAIATHRRAIELDPELGSAWINLGNVLAELGRYDEAREALEKARALDPSDPRPRSSLSDLAELQARQPRGAPP